MSAEAKSGLSVNVDTASAKRHAEEEKHDNAANTDNNEPNKKKKKIVKIWCDGCFDMMHYGHANALRQAREEGDYLIVGVHSDAEVLRHKGPPVMTEAERYAAVRGCKWVDEVVEDAPYVTDLEWMDKYGADICVHGEDPSYDENGRDTYWKVKEANRFRIVKRTQGVSTTDLVGRMLLMTMDHLPASVKAAQPVSVSDDKNVRVVQPGPAGPITPWSSPKSTSFLASSMTLAQFAAGNRSPTESDRIVYIDGAFDLFHVGHIEALRIAKSFGTYLIVGIHDDAIVNQMKGSNLPIMNVHERTLSVLQCRYVDQVITGAPWHITEQVIKQLKISLVVRGAASDYKGPADEECYKVPKEMGIFREFPSPLSNLTTGSIIERILENRKKFQERNQKKVKGEVAFANQIAAQHAEHIAKVDGAKPADQH